MGLFTSINIAATGMSVERLRTDVISDNIANARTTRTPDGGKFKPSTVVLQAISENNNLQYRNPFLPENLDTGIGGGVRVAKITKDDTQGRMIYDPTHPDAILSGPYAGYVEYPNVNIVNEIVNLISASRAYEANSTVVQGSKEMFLRALEIGR